MPKRSLLAALALVGMALFAALGVWQVERRAWKLDLIARVEARVHAAPGTLPPPAAWAAARPDTFEYRRVHVRGIYLNDRETLVQALTERGAGFWVVTPLRTAEGIILINRGFVPEDRRDPASRRAGQIEGETVVTGLMRVTEPGGGFLRTNAPAQGRWYSRDVRAIAAAARLANVAPFFLDADDTPNPGGYPAGGLTVIRFPNNHLVYALTWFGLALLCAGGAVLVLRERERA